MGAGWQRWWIEQLTPLEVDPEAARIVTVALYEWRKQLFEEIRAEALEAFRSPLLLPETTPGDEEAWLKQNKHRVLFDPAKGGE